jgi:hypothetical protein
MHLPAVARVFRLILYWKRLFISGSSSIGNGPSFQAHLVLDNSASGREARSFGTLDVSPAERGQQKCAAAGLDGWPSG